MKKLLLFSFFFAQLLIAQEAHVYGPITENNFDTWIKEGTGTPHWWVSDHKCGYFQGCHGHNG
ncbi:MAG: hypothetical protein K9J12_11175 [Melioribacteraceae bacterium]|nr:hypothetical protein [Melioribacteraceae bacterium]MCF8264465.1 hypothetical protein [Melioribacteraceae bacterium]